MSLQSLGWRILPKLPSNMNITAPEVYATHARKGMIHQIKDRVNWTIAPISPHHNHPPPPPPTPETPKKKNYNCFNLYYIKLWFLQFRVLLLPISIYYLKILYILHTVVFDAIILSGFLLLFPFFFLADHPIGKSIRK